MPTNENGRTHGRQARSKRKNGCIKDRPGEEPVMARASWGEAVFMWAIGGLGQGAGVLADRVARDAQLALGAAAAGMPSLRSRVSARRWERLWLD